MRTVYIRSEVSTFVRRSNHAEQLARSLRNQKIGDRTIKEQEFFTKLNVTTARLRAHDPGGACNGESVIKQHPQRNDYNIQPREATILER